MVISQVFCINPEAEMINDNPETGNKGIPGKVPGSFACEWSCYLHLTALHSRRENA